MPPYDESNVYVKFQGSSSEEEGCSGCEGSTSKCSECCPPGLVGVRDAGGNFSGCLTPNDAQLFLEETRTCTEGYIKLYKEGEIPLFRGCVSESEYAELYAALNPA